MPLYQVALRQARELGGVGAYKWSNTVHIFAPTATSAAVQVAQGWVDLLRDGFREDVYCYEAYATDVSAPNSEGTPNTVDYASAGIAPAFQRGSITTEFTGEAYWADLCLNVEFNVPNSRPDRKYARPGLRESDFNASGQFVAPGLAAAHQGAWSAFVFEYGITTGDNEEITLVTVTKAGIRRLGRTARFDVPPPPPLG